MLRRRPESIYLIIWNGSSDVHFDSDGDVPALRRLFFSSFQVDLKFYGKFGSFDRD